MGYFPFFYKLADKNILIVGGGEIALAKLESLILYSNKITLVAPNFLNELTEIAKEKEITLLTKNYDDSLLDSHDIIIIATNDHKLNRDIATKARLKHKIVNLVDDADNSDFIFPALVKRDNITIAISSSGISPVLSRLLKQKIENLVPHNFTNLDQFIRKTREKVKSKLTKIQPRRMFWQEVLESNIATEVLAGNSNKAEKLLNQKLANNNNKDQAALYLIGAGPGDPELITLKAIKLLSRADIVLYDRLVSQEILNYARKDAIKINVGKTKDFHKYSQNEINQLIRNYIKEGNIVARLKGGDTAIFAHLYEEIEAIKDLNIPYQIVPGISAANGAAAYTGIALTARDFAKSVRYLSLYKRDMYNEEYWQDLANTDDSLVFYMSVTNINLIVENLLKHGRDPKTGITIIEQATTKFQKSYPTTLKNFATKYANQKFISPSIIIIGEVVNYAQNFAWKEESQKGTYFLQFKTQKKVEYVE